MSSVHYKAPQTRRRFESLKREAVAQMLVGTSLRHATETLGMTESLPGNKWRRQYEQQSGKEPRTIHHEVNRI